jgi:hypothetical protein
VDQSVKAQSWLNKRRDVPPQSVVVFSGSVAKNW